MRLKPLAQPLLASLLTVALAGPVHAVVSAGKTDRSGLADYVVGRLAQSEEDLNGAALSYAAALSDSPGDPLLMRRAFELALAAGNEQLAYTMADRLAVGDGYEPTVSLVLATRAVKQRNWKAFEAQGTALAEAGYGGFALPIMQAWVLHERGRHARALELLAQPSSDPFAASYMTEHRGHLLAADRKWADAATAFGQLLSGNTGQNPRLRVALARALQGDNRRAEAKRILDTGDRDPLLDRATEALLAGQPIEAGPQTAADGIAALYTRMSADLSRERATPIALVLARLATMLAPESADAKLATAAVLARGGQYEPAIAVLEGVDPADPAASLARAQRAALLEEVDRPKESLELLEAAAHRESATSDDWARYGDVLRSAERNAEAAEAYAQAIKLTRTLSPDHWQLFFLYGSALEQAGNWPAAEEQLRQALDLAPEQAVVLNYLGYSMLDRGLKLDEAHALIEKAHRLKPDDGYIADSLGWSHYRAGRYQEAVRLLEFAFERTPADPTIGEHLGDAYWKVGRRLEARYRWQAALASEPTDAQRTGIETKLRLGLELAMQRAPRPRP